MMLRGGRGADVVRRLGSSRPDDAADVIAACERVAARTLAVPPHEVVVSETPSRSRPGARGRWLAGTVTLFPPAFADPLTLAWTMLHELAHAAGADHAGADAFAAGVLAAPTRPRPPGRRSR